MVSSCGQAEFNGKGKDPCALVSKPTDFHSLETAAHQAETAMITDISPHLIFSPHSFPFVDQCYYKKGKLRHGPKWQLVQGSGHHRQSGGCIICWPMSSISFPIAASKKQALWLGGCFSEYPHEAWRRPGWPNPALQHGYSLLPEPSFPEMISGSRMALEAPSPSQAEVEVQPSPLLSMAQLTPIQAADTFFFFFAQGVSELGSLWMPFCVKPLAQARSVPSLFQQLPDRWGDRHGTRHGPRAGPHQGLGEKGRILVDLPSSSREKTMPGEWRSFKRATLHHKQWHPFRGKELGPE